MTMEDEPERFGKRDRLARMLRVVAVLRGHPDGIRPPEIARRVGVATRTVYRDLRALEEEVGVAVWSEDGLWGVVGEEFLPPLKLTLDEAMAVVLSARLMVRYADKYDPDLAAAFEKLEEVLPRPLAEHVERTLDVLVPASPGRGVQRARPSTDPGLGRAPGRDPRVRAGPLRARMSTARQAVVRPYLIEPSLQTHALYLIGWDETRDALRTFKIERIRDVALTPRTFELPEGDGVERHAPAGLGHHRGPAAGHDRAALHAGGGGPGAGGDLAPDPEASSAQTGRLAGWRATVAGTIEIRLWILSWGDDVEVLEPETLRKDVASTHRRAGERYDAVRYSLVTSGVG